MRLTFAASRPTITECQGTSAAALQGEGRSGAGRGVAIDLIMSTKRIKVLADELNLLISRMEVGQASGHEASETLPNPTLADWLEAAMDVYNLRRAREKLFGTPQLFGEPTWDILLDLFIAELKNTKIQTTSACIGAQVPQTTALRWIALLERENLIHRYRDRTDSRRIYIRLTDIALGKMAHLFYDRCASIMARKPAPRPGSGTPGYEEACADAAADLVAQIKARRLREENAPR